MAKHLEPMPSPFNKLLDVKRARERDSQTASGSVGPDGQTSSQIAENIDAIGAPVRLAKSADPNFTKFTTYIRKNTHLAAKLRVVAEGRELSEIVEELLSRWAAEKP